MLVGRSVERAAIVETHPHPCQTTSGVILNTNHRTDEGGGGKDGTLRVLSLHVRKTVGVLHACMRQKGSEGTLLVIDIRQRRGGGQGLNLAGSVRAC
jgi:hypothetical protein